MTKEEFLVSSIQDIQSTIRAIDAKIFGILIILILPFSIIPDIKDSLTIINSCNSIISSMLLFTMALTWMASLIMSILTVFSIGNPVSKVDFETDFKSKKTLQGSYFNGDLYKISFFNSIFPFKIKSLVKFEQYKESLEENAKNLIEELILEQFKLCYIRDIKLKRLNSALLFLGIYLLSLLSIILLNFYLS